jgi:hypothetical protein
MASLLADRWPELPLAAWRDTRDTLHLWTQVVGKVRLTLTPWLNHSWHVALYVTARGLTTSPMPCDGGSLEIEFDFIEHVVWLRLSNGHFRKVAMRPVSVAAFHAEMRNALSELGLLFTINPMPCEIPGAIPFGEDDVHKSYDPEYTRRFFRVLTSAHEVMSHFRTGFLGKASPVHFFWGSFDLAVTRFSGRPAPPRPDADVITREAYSHEVISHGWWPGQGPLGKPAFYSYSAPAPEGLANAKIQPSQAYYSKDLGEFLLLYDDVRTAGNPEAALMNFFQTTYEAGANLAHWDRPALER